MADLPIIFSGPMVRALLDERKTQTRRSHPPEPRFAPDGCTQPDLGGRPCWWDYWASDRAETHRFKLPYAVGDRLYVREAVTWVSAWGWRYRADNDDLTEKRATGEVYKLTPSIHMPRAASRLTLTVTDVRVQRLQDISEADAVAEGCRGYISPDGEDGVSPQEEYRALWNSLNGPGAWEANPWVAAYTFTVARGNIDQIGGSP